MDVRMVLGVGCVVTRGSCPGSYSVVTWLRDSKSSESERHSYVDLSADELGTLLGTFFFEAMPGWEMLEGCWQPSLFDRG